MTDIDIIEKQPWLSKKEWAIALVPLGPIIYQLFWKPRSPSYWSEWRRMQLVQGTTLLLLLALLPSVHIALWGWAGAAFLIAFLQPSPKTILQMHGSEEQKALASACERDSL